MNSINPGKKSLLFYISIALLSLSTITLDHYIQPFIKHSNNLLDNSELTTNITHGEIEYSREFSHDVLTLKSFSNNKHVSYQRMLMIDQREKYLQYSFEIKVNEINPGEYFWETMRTSIHLYDDNNMLIKSSEASSTYFNKPENWQSTIKNIIIPDNTSYAIFSIEFLNSSGSVTIKNLKLHYTEESNLHNIIRIILLTTWFIVLLSYLITILRIQDKLWSNIIVVTPFLLVLIAITMPFYLKNKIILAYSYMTSYFEGNLISHYIQEPMLIGHFIAFLLLSTVSFSRLLRFYSTQLITIHLCIFSVITEILQILVIGRTPQIEDITVDLLGILTGLLLVKLFNIKTS